MKNWLTKLKQVNTKQQKQQFFVPKNFIRGKKLFTFFKKLSMFLINPFTTTLLRA